MGSDFQEDHAARSAGAPGRDARGKWGIFALYCGRNGPERRRFERSRWRRITSACSGHVKVSRILRSAKCAPLCHAADARR